MSSYNTPDLTAPRCRSSRKRVVSCELFKAFRKKYPNHVQYSDEILKEIIEKHHEKIYNTIINERDGVELQGGLGYLFIGSYKTKKKQIDLLKSMKAGKPIQQRNWETDGHVGKIFYSNCETKYKISNRELWEFKAVRQFKRKVSEIYRKDWKNYILVDNMVQISSLFRKNRYRHMLIRDTKQHLEDYNEFKID